MKQKLALGKSVRAILSVLLLFCLLAATGCGDSSEIAKGSSGNPPITSELSASSDVTTPEATTPADPDELITATPADKSATDMSQEELEELFETVIGGYRTITRWIWGREAYNDVDASLPVLHSLDIDVREHEDYPDGFNLLPLSRFRTRAELEAEWIKICSARFTSALVEPLFLQELFIELDGQLYISERGDGSTYQGMDLDMDTLKINAANDGLVYFNVDNHGKSTEFRIVQEDGFWVLDFISSN